MSATSSVNSRNNSRSFGVSLEDLRRTDEMREQIKTIGSQALHEGCTYLKEGVKSVTHQQNSIPHPVTDVLTNSCLSKAEEKCQNAIGKSVDSQHCFGNSDSYISRFTRWVSSWWQ